MKALAEPPRTIAVMISAKAPATPNMVAKSMDRPGLGLATVGEVREMAILRSARPGQLDRSDLMISVIVTPSRSSTTTTSPRATSRLLT